MSRNRISCEMAGYLDTYRNILNEMIAGMQSAELTDSISHNFIVQMIPHHRAAIEMSRNLLQYAPCAPLEKIAQGIIEEQTQSIAAMEAILPACGDMTNTPDAVERYQQRTGCILQTMFSAMCGACESNNVNANFMWEMIPHHCGAVRMSKNALDFAVCPGLDEILDSIITSQERGIRQMRHLLNCMGCCQP